MSAPLKAITIWQPWATLIMVGAKPFEFRGWQLPRSMIGRDVVIHAGARPMRLTECADLIKRLLDPDEAWSTGLIKDKAEPVLWLALNSINAAKDRKMTKGNDLFAEDALPEPAGLPLSAGLGVVRLNESVHGSETAKTFDHVINDSDRSQHSNWGWPVSDIRPFDEPFFIRGAQGFWNWPSAEGMADAN